MSGTPLNIVAPLTVDDAMLVESDVPEDDAPEWNSGTTYGIGDRVIVTAHHSLYESLIAGNVNNSPPSILSAWALVGPTNRWKCFDGSNSTQTSQRYTISYTLRPRVAINTLAALNVTDAISMRVRMVDPVFGDVYDRTVDYAALPPSADWYSWFYSERIGRPASVGLLRDLPLYPAADLIVEFVGGPGLSVGVLLMGTARPIGLGVKQGMRLGIVDYSNPQTNDFGDTVLVQRAFAKRASFDLVLQREEVDETIELLASLRAKPCLWIGHPYYASSVVYGFYKEFEVLIAYRNVADCAIDIRGLT